MSMGSSGSILLSSLKPDGKNILGERKRYMKIQTGRTTLKRRHWMEEKETEEDIYQISHLFFPYVLLSKYVSTCFCSRGAAWFTRARIPGPHSLHGDEVRAAGARDPEGIHIDACSLHAGPRPDAFQSSGHVYGKRVYGCPMAIQLHS